MTFDNPSLQIKDDIGIFRSSSFSKRNGGNAINNDSNSEPPTDFINPGQNARPMRYSFESANNLASNRSYSQPHMQRNGDFFDRQNGYPSGIGQLSDSGTNYPPENKFQDYSRELDRQIHEKRRLMQDYDSEAGILNGGSSAAVNSDSYNMYENAQKQNPFQFRAGLADLRGSKPTDEHIKQEEERKRLYREMLGSSFIS